MAWASPSLSPPFIVRRHSSLYQSSVNQQPWQRSPHDIDGWMRQKQTAEKYQFCSTPQIVTRCIEVLFHEILWFAVKVIFLHHIFLSRRPIYFLRTHLLLLLLQILKICGLSDVSNHPTCCVYTPLRVCSNVLLGPIHKIRN